MGKNQPEKNIADAMNKYFQISQRLANASSMAIPSVIPAIQRSLERTERISKVIAPIVHNAEIVSRFLPISVESLSSLIDSLPATDRFISVFSGELSSEELYNLSKDVVFEIEENYQRHPSIDEYEGNVHEDEADDLIEKIFDNVGHDVPPSVISSYIDKVPEVLRAYAADKLISIMFGIAWYFFSGQIESDPAVALLGPIISAIRLLLGRK